MKICFVLPFDGIAGGIFIVYEHARRLMEKGHDVAIVFARRTTRIASYPGMDRVPTRWLGDIGDDEEFDIACATWCAHFGHRDHSDRSIVISEIGGS